VKNELKSLLDKGCKAKNKISNNAAEKCKLLKPFAAKGFRSDLLKALPAKGFNG